MTVKIRLEELRSLGQQIAAAKNLSTEEAANIAYLLKEIDGNIQTLVDSALKQGQWDKDFDTCQMLSKKIWTVINQINPQSFESAWEPTDAFDWIVINEVAQSALNRTGTPKEQPKTPPKSETAKTPIKEELQPPLPDIEEQLIPVGGHLGTGDELDMLLDDATAYLGMQFESSVKPPSSGSTTTTSTASTLTTTTHIAPEVVQGSEKQFTATIRNINPAAGQQICMQFISEFARFLRDPSHLDQDMIIQQGNEIYHNTKNIHPEMLHCLQTEMNYAFTPIQESYLQLLNDLDGRRNGFKGGAIPMIGTVLTCQSNSIAIGIVQKNRQMHFHIFYPDNKPTAFRKEYASKEEAAHALVEWQKSIKDDLATGTMHIFVRKQDFLLSSKLKMNGSGSNSQSTTAPVLPLAGKTESVSSSSSSSQSSTVPVLPLAGKTGSVSSSSSSSQSSTVPVLPLAGKTGSVSSSSSTSQSTTVPVLPLAGKTGSISSSSSSSQSSTVSRTASVLRFAQQNMFGNYAQRLQEIQKELAFSEKPADLKKAFQALKDLKEQTKDQKTSIGSLVLAHLYCLHAKTGKTQKLGYTMASAFQNHEITSTPEERHIAFNHAIIDVLLDGLETAYQARDFINAQSYVGAIRDFCNQSAKDRVKEIFKPLEAITQWPPALTSQVTARIMHIQVTRGLLKKSWGIK